jgi:hypothetical protein
MIMIAIIEQIISYDESLEKKHEILTAIGLATASEDLFRACEAVRNDLPDSSNEVQVSREELLRGRAVGFIEGGDYREEKSDEISGAE